VMAKIPKRSLSVFRQPCKDREYSGNCVTVVSFAPRGSNLDLINRGVSGDCVDDGEE